MFRILFYFRERINLAIVLFQRRDINGKLYIIFSIALPLYTDKIKSIFILN